MEKQIRIVDSDGKETILEGNFENAVRVEILEKQPEKYWFETPGFKSRFRTEICNGWCQKYKETAASTKKDAIVNYIAYLCTCFYKEINDGKWFVEHLDASMEELRKHV